MLSTTGSCHHEEDMPAKAVLILPNSAGHVLRWKWVSFIRVVKSHEGWSHLSKHSWQPDTLFSSFNSDAPMVGRTERGDWFSTAAFDTVGIIVTDNMFLLNQRCCFVFGFHFLCNSPLASCEFLFPRDVESLRMGSLLLTKCYAVLFFITCVCRLSMHMWLC